MNMGPGPMIDLMGLLACKAALTALRLGVFDSLSGKTATVKELASLIRADQTGLSLLLNALESLGYVKAEGGKWRVTPMTEKWLLKNSPYNITGLFHQFDDMASRWDYLHESIREGHPPLLGYEWLDRDPDKWEHYQEGLKSAAILVCRELLKKVKIPASARTLIDLGGGHGQYCIEFCKKYPRLEGTVYDWPQAEKTALDNINKAGLSDRVSFETGDFVREPIESGYDIILMFNVIRIFNAGELSALLRKVYESLDPGGMVIIMDHLGHVPRSRFMKANSFLVLLELYNSIKGRTHSASELALLLRGEGYANIREYKLKKSPGLGVLTAYKK